MSSFARGLALQLEVVHALVLRETRTRFGAHQLGYLWALLEPIFMILTFYVVFRLANRRVPEGMDLFSFITTGYAPYMLFANSASRVADAIRSNKALLFYPRVHTLDLVYARAALEAATQSAVFVVLMAGHALYHERFAIDSALMTVAGFALASLFGTALGLVFCTLDQFSQAVERVRGPLMRPMFWISGIFFVASELPDGVRGAMLYNPLLHATELVRAGWFPSHDASVVDVGYCLVWIVTLAFIGLSLERIVRHRVELT